MHPVRLLSQPDSTTVLNALNKSAIAHFACHGCSDTTNPARSYLALQGQDESVPDKLTLQSISEANLSQVWLAYLSACSTAENRDPALADEALHLASGFQAAGFKHTVAAMWASEDNICPQVAECFYSELITSADMDENRAVAAALHKATNQFRLEHLDEPYLWAQYAHYGA
jgi:CHAT domain-containing protein